MNLENHHITLGLTTIGILLVATFGLWIWAIAALNRLSKEISVKNVRIASILSSLAFGWLIGLIIYLMSIKPKADQYEETRKVAFSGFLLGAAISFGITFIIGFGAIIYSINVLQNIANKANADFSNSTKVANKKPSISTTKDKVTQSPTKTDTPSTSIVENEVFKAEFPCKNPAKLEKDGHTMTGCADLANIRMIIYGNLPDQIPDRDIPAVLEFANSGTSTEYDKVLSITDTKLFGLTGLSTIGQKSSSHLRQDVGIRNIGSKTQMIQVLVGQRSSDIGALNQKFEEFKSKIQLK